MLQVVSVIQELMDRLDLEPSMQNSVEGEIHSQHVSTAKAHDVLDWIPEYDVEDTLRETITWYRRFFAWSKASKCTRSVRSPTSVGRSCTCSGATIRGSWRSARSTSPSSCRAIKAWHLHRVMTLNYAVPSGRIKLVLYDGREECATPRG